MISSSSCQQWLPDSPANPAGDHESHARSYTTPWDAILWFHGFWRTNDLEVSVRETHSYGYDNATLHKFYTVRVDPSGVSQMLQGSPKEKTALQAAFEARRSASALANAKRTSPIPPPIPVLQPNLPPPPLEPIAATPIAAKHAGGAPRKDFWDDLWLAMFERLWLTDWKPKNQAEIENAMLDWASAKGYELGPTSVKKPAKKLFSLTEK